MAPPKPPQIVFLGLLGRVPRPLARVFVGALMLVGLVPTGLLFSLRRAFARVLAHQGRPADSSALNALLRRFLSYYVGSFQNLCALCACDPPPAPAVPVELDALASIEALRREGRGVVLATPHYGDLYSAIVALGAKVPLTVLMVFGESYHWAESGGLRFVEFLEGAADCVAALRRNECVLVYADLDLVPGNRAAAFFGAPAFPPHGPARLALATGAAILPVCAPWSSERTRLICDEPIRPDGLTQESLEDACFRGLERLIARAPEQWIVLYDLWDLDKMRRVAQGYRSRTVARFERAKTA